MRPRTIDSTTPIKPAGVTFTAAPMIDAPRIWRASATIIDPYTQRHGNAVATVDIVLDPERSRPVWLFWRDLDPETGDPEYSEREAESAEDPFLTTTSSGALTDMLTAWAMPLLREQLRHCTPHLVAPSVVVMRAGLKEQLSVCAAHLQQG